MTSVMSTTAQRTRTNEFLASPASGLAPHAVWPLPADPTAAARARTALRATLGALGVPASVVDDALIGVCELVANAVTHARGPHELRLWAHSGSIRCEVTDACPRPVDFPAPAVADRHLAELPASSSLDDALGAGDEDPLSAVDSCELSEHGRGLALVAVVSDGRCGCAVTPAGKTVWFTLSTGGR